MGRALLLILGLGMLAGCAATPVAPPAPVAAPPPPVLPQAGLDRVMGQDATALGRLFGPADLDQREGPARKLQYRSTICVLDAYLYPAAAGGAPRVTWTDARTPAGEAFDRASCVAALARRPAAAAPPASPRPSPRRPRDR